MKLSREDFLDRLSGFSFQRTTKHKEGHEITYIAIAIDDVIQVLDEFMDEEDIIITGSIEELSKICKVPICPFRQS